MNKFSHVIKIIVIAVIAGGLMMILLFTGREGQDFTEKYAGFDLSGESSGRANIYSRYIERYSHIPAGKSDISINLLEWSSAEGVSVLENFEGVNRVLRTEELSFVEYTVNIDQAGLYNIHIEYFPVPARGIPIERALYINGEIPFLGADRLVFPRIWGDSAVSRYDNQGNEIRPSQIEKPYWESVWFRDSQGYFTEPYVFYLHEGMNTIKLTGINEPLVIRSLLLTAPVKQKSYREYLAGVNLNRYANAAGDFSLKIQGENAARRSDSSLYAIYDRSSGATEPASVAEIRLNMIGGEAWRISGQWIEWEFEVPENGMYRITFKGRQNYNRGFVTNRTVMINGEVPFKELEVVPFSYNNKWSHTTLADEQGEILVPLDKGAHTLRLQATLGEIGEMLNIMEESVFRLNAIYRKILVLTGPEPDLYRDYRINIVYPDIIGAMLLESRILYKLVDDMERYSGERSEEAAVALTLARQMELFAGRPDKIPRALANFRINISSLGDSLLSLSQSCLDIDYILITGETAPIQPIKENFFVAALHEIKSFIASFFVDYNNIGNVYKGDEAIEVWILSGRDQSTILKSMIDDTFTPSTGIRVNLKLVAPDAVMPAVVAGTGPDLALTVQQGDVINYALRGAVVDISGLQGYRDVIKELDYNVIVPFEFQGGIYGLPETQYFHVMYYRKDIMDELELELPDTWEDLINIFPIIQKNNMNVGVPSVATSERENIDFSNFLAHLFQRGGRLYNEDGSRTLLDTETAIDAFDFYTKLFTHYKAPVIYNFINRFRTGEMPIAFADYSWFNTLEIFAPEIRGLWSFTRMPGLKRENGVIDRSVSTGTLAAMIFSNSKLRDQSWEFLKWWIGSNTQLRFGRELESLMGSAARYPTANYAAFRQLPWGAEQMAVLDEQRSWAVGIPEVPGGYFVSRHIINATRRIINKKKGREFTVDVRETLLDYSFIINDELIKKRKEFGLERE